MCGRFTQMFSWHELWDLYAITAPMPLEDRRPDFNVAPTREVPVVRARDGQREAPLLRWGLVPFFAKGVPGKYSTINARVEGIEKSPSYRGPWKRGQRCILPANGFYEWHLNADGHKQPFYITCNDQRIFGFAGLWDRSLRDDGVAVESCTIITMAANALMYDIHNTGANPHRMPAILAPGDTATWLQGTAEEAVAVLKPYAADHMLAWPVTTRVNTPKNNDDKLIEAMA